MTNFHVNYVGFFELKNERKSTRDSKKKIDMLIYYLSVIMMLYKHSKKLTSNNRYFLRKKGMYGWVVCLVETKRENEVFMF